MVSLVWGERYESQALVGSTRAGELHLGWDRSLHRPVALGVFKGMAGEQRDVLLREIRTAAGQSWPSLPEIYDVGMDGGTVYVVYGRTEGRPFWKECVESPKGGAGKWESRLADLGGAVLEWNRAGLSMLSVDPRWLWVRSDGGIVLYGLGAEETPLTRQLARTAVQLATGNIDAPLQWEALESWLAQEQYPPLWIQAFGHWWLRAASQDPETRFPDLEACVRALREVMSGMSPVSGDTRPAGTAAGTVGARKEDGGPVPGAKRGTGTKGHRAALGRDALESVREFAFGRGHRAPNPRKALMGGPGGKAMRHRPGGGASGFLYRFHWSRAAMAAMVILLAVVGGASLAYAVFMRGPGEVTMPFVVGKSYDAAVGALVQAGLDPSKVVKEPQSSTQPPGTVIGQDPYGGKTLKPDRVVHLQVAVPPNSSGQGAPPGQGMPGQATPDGEGSGPGPSVVQPPAAGSPGDKTMPDLTGLTLDQAQSQLLNLGIHFRYEIVSSDRPKGTVIDQSPSPGTRVGDKDQAVFRVSRGS
ncbi:MAG: PASTA domain-containing protein [Kyrpidia sp.]|nr:PASTA domain-containing protein [Kyrpidia sp.]